MKYRIKVFLVCLLCLLSYCAIAMRDPTRPPDAYRYIEDLITSSAYENSFVLREILITKGHRLANINGKTLEVGDIIKSVVSDKKDKKDQSGKDDTVVSAKVVKINDDTVDIKIGSQLIKLPLFSQDTVSAPRK